MAISFPINPVVGQSVYLSGTRYTFDGIAWTIATTNVLGTRRAIEYTAASGQTEFLTTYNLDNSEVFINGIKLESIEYSISYTSINGKVTLLQAANEGDVVEIIAYGTYDILNEIYYKGDVEPVSSIEGSLWFNTNTNILNIYDGSSWIGYNSLIFNTTTTSGLSEQIIDAFKMSEYRSAEYVITCSSSYGFMSLKMLVLHDDVNVYDTVYGQIGETLGTFSTTISDSYVNVLFTPSYDGVEVIYNKIMIENTII